MIKRDEIANPNSCLNKAADDEMLFVLREKDEAMAATIEFWANERLKLGLNWESDSKITEARATAYNLRNKPRAKI